jgi:hypothetical protein
MLNHSRALSLACSLVLAVACKGSDSRKEPLDTTVAESGGDAAEHEMVRAHVVLTGGRNAGSYDIADAKYSTCIPYEQSAKTGASIAYMGDAEETKSGIIQLQYATQKFDAAKSGTKEFDLIVGIATDGLPMGTQYVVQQHLGKGSGTSTVSGSGPGYTVTVKGKTADGVGVEATIECVK